MSLINLRFRKKLPKTAIPCDNESYIGSPTPFHLCPYRFVYYTRKSKIVLEFDGKPTSPRRFYSISLINNNVHISHKSKNKAY